MIRSVTAPLLALSALVLAPGCMSLDYELAQVPVPVSASPPAAGTSSGRFHVEGKHLLWAHGLLGESKPDVAAMVADASRGAHGVASFRVTHGAGFHEWLLTHLSLTLVRMKTVTVEGELVGARDSSGATLRRSMSASEEP